jgi:sulfite reductase (NADPH) flavoprotein alpha-component
LQKCDTDYETEAGHWFDTILQQLASGGKQQSVAAPSQLATPGSAVADPGKAVVTPRHSGKTIYTGTVLANINLNDRGSGKRTHHLEIAAEEVDYQPGDSIGIVPWNPLPMVEGILALSGVDPARVLSHRTEEWPVAHLLQKKLNIVYLHERVVKKYAAIVRQEIPQTKIGLLDLLKIYPVRNGNQFLEVISILEPIAPRLYSISSSPEAHAGEIHLTVAKDTFAVNGETKHGLCSDNLSQLVPGQTLEFYVHRNSQFRLPAPEKDIIMIGPGTGIAPFRSFLAERDSIGAPGKNWLFFGDQHFTTDFLYQTEIQDWAQTGVLTKVNTAFSRDQAQKVYVQHRMQQQAAGAVPMAGIGRPSLSVRRQRTDERGCGEYPAGDHPERRQPHAAQAIGYLDELKETGRFAKDVY